MIEHSTVQSFVDQFSEIKSRLPGEQLDWLTPLRDLGIARFGQLGMPTTRLETWKYTKLQPFDDTAFKPVSEIIRENQPQQSSSIFPEDADVFRLVFSNGYLDGALSNVRELPAGLTVQTLAQAMDSNPEWLQAKLCREHNGESEALVALNAAMMESGYVIHVAQGAKIEKPVEVIFMGGITSKPVAHHPRNLVVLEEGSEVTLVKNNIGFGVGPYLSNTVTDIEIADGAKLRHYKVQAETLEAVHLSTINVEIGADSLYEYFGLSIGGRLSRTEISAHLNGSGGHCSINGSYLMRGSEHCDYTTVIEHHVPDTTCSEVFKGVLDDDSRGVFQGKIIVHKDAQRTDGRQLSKALLLSNKAEMDAKPELEIYADDVKCAHGATTGQLDETSLFYLRSRGIPEAQARNLLIQSFLGEALEQVSDEKIRSLLMDRIFDWLPAQCYRADEWTSE